MSGWRGGVSWVECLIRRILLVGFLSPGSLVSAESRHHLASWNATEQGVEELRQSPVLQGGWVRDGRWSINSSGINHLMPTELF